MVQWKMGSWKMCGLCANGLFSTSMIMGGRVIKDNFLPEMDGVFGVFPSTSQHPVSDPFLQKGYPVSSRISFKSDP